MPATLRWIARSVAIRSALAFRAACRSRAAHISRTAFSSRAVCVSRTVAALCAAGALLGSCVSLPVPGTSNEADVIAAFGKPVDTRSLADGSRQLDYPRGPMGRETWRATLSADGRLERLEQLLDEAHFARLKPGMTTEEVHRVLGRHFITSEYRNLEEQVWSWRYVDVSTRHMFFNAHFDVRTGLLKTTSRTDEYLPQRGRR